MRWRQHLPLSTLEIITFATIVTTLNSLFFWYHNPLDVETQIIIRMENWIADVLIDAGDSARKPYSRTPLDFLKSPPASTSVVAPFWFGLGVVINFDKESCSRPLKRFGNCKTRPPAGLTTIETIFGVLFEVVYFGVHLVSWNQLFASKVEFYLWLVSNFVLLSVLATYLIAIPIAVVLSRPFSRRWLPKEVGSPLEVAAQLPRWLQVMIHAPILALYVAVRSYILLEGLISLRALPLKCYADISWPNFLPHMWPELVLFFVYCEYLYKFGAKLFRYLLDWRAHVAFKFGAVH